MENTDIIVLTSVLVVLFLVFIIATVREFGEMSKKKYDEKYEAGGPPSDFLMLAGKLFTEEHISTKKRIVLVDAIKNALEDLEIKEEENRKDINSKN